MFSNKLFQNYSRQCIQHYPASETAQCSMLCSLLWPVDIFVWKTKKYQGVKDMLCVFYMQNNSWEYIKRKIVSMVMIQRYESMILYFQEIQKMRKLKRSKHADSMASGFNCSLRTVAGCLLLNSDGASSARKGGAKPRTCAVPLWLLKAKPQQTL